MSDIYVYTSKGYRAVEPDEPECGCPACGSEAQPDIEEGKYEGAMSCPDCGHSESWITPEGEAEMNRMQEEQLQAEMAYHEAERREVLGRWAAHRLGLDALDDRGRPLAPCPGDVPYSAVRTEGTVTMRFQCCDAAQLLNGHAVNAWPDDSLWPAQPEYVEGYDDDDDLPF